MSQPHNTNKESIAALGTAESTSPAIKKTNHRLDTVEPVDTVPAVAPRLQISNPGLEILGITEERLNEHAEQARLLALRNRPFKERLIDSIKLQADAMVRHHNAEFLRPNTVLAYLQTKGEVLTKKGEPMTTVLIGGVLGGLGMNLPWVGGRVKYYALTLANSPEDEVLAAKEALDHATATELLTIRRA